MTRNMWVGMTTMVLSVAGIASVAVAQAGADAPGVIGTLRSVPSPTTVAAGLVLLSSLVVSRRSHSRVKAAAVSRDDEVDRGVAG